MSWNRGIWIPDTFILVLNNEFGILDADSFVTELGSLTLLTKTFNVIFRSFFTVKIKFRLTKYLLALLFCFLVLG